MTTGKRETRVMLTRVTCRDTSLLCSGLLVQVSRQAGRQAKAWFCFCRRAQGERGPHPRLFDEGAAGGAGGAQPSLCDIGTGSREGSLSTQQQSGLP